jgi:hypothetical protein
MEEEKYIFTNNEWMFFNIVCPIIAIVAIIFNGVALFDGILSGEFTKDIPLFSIYLICTVIGGITQSIMMNNEKFMQKNPGDFIPILSLLTMLILPCAAIGIFFVWYPTPQNISLFIAGIIFTVGCSVGYLVFYSVTLDYHKKEADENSSTSNIKPEIINLD